jgi:predicted Zn-dependent protease
MRAYVESRPQEPFPRYGLAMEYAKVGQLEDADAEFQELRRLHPEYVATYYHHGMLLLRMGRKEDARLTWEEGIRVSTAKGDLHTRGEIEAALLQLDGPQASGGKQVVAPGSESS